MYWCRNKNFSCFKKVFFYYSLILGSEIKKKKFFLGYEYLSTPELELFVAKLLIGIICGGIFINARVGIIQDRIFTGARVRNIINKSS